VTTAARRVAGAARCRFDKYPFATSQLSVVATAARAATLLRCSLSISSNNSRVSPWFAAKLMARPESVAQLCSSHKEWIVGFAVIGVASMLAKK
jgi:hypothetical protein